MKYLNFHFLVLSVCSLNLGQLGSLAADLDPVVPRFVDNYCMDCHDGDSEKGDRNFEAFLENPNSEHHLKALESILEQLNLGEMPPAKKSVTQPPHSKRRTVINAISSHLRAHEFSLRPASTVMRRLNRFEYLNTMRDLLGVDTRVFDPTVDFPQDAREEGFDNLGESLILSSVLMNLYLKAATAFLDQAIFFQDEPPRSRLLSYEPKDFVGVNSKTRSSVSWQVRHGKDHNGYLDVGGGGAVPRMLTLPTALKKNGVPETGRYRIRIRAEAVNRVTHPYDRKMVPIDYDAPLKMSLWTVPDAKLLKKGSNAGRNKIALFELEDDHPRDFEVTIYMTKGSVPFLNWINGYPTKGVIRRIFEKYHSDLAKVEKMTPDLAADGNPAAIALMKRAERGELPGQVLSDVYAGPRMRIHGMTLEGPLNETWPPASHQKLFGKETDPRKVDVSRVIHNFTLRAFRQPVEIGEVHKFIDFIHQRVAMGDTHEESIRYGLIAVLTSPRFLFLDEGNEEESAELSSYELATRLSYFLWSSMPDDHLFKLAESNQLDAPGVLYDEVERMLKDEKGGEFVTRFTDAWLRLNELGSMPPDKRNFKSYYDDRLETAMKQETRLFFAHLLQENRPITELLSSDYTFANDALARHYGIPGVRGESFEKVDLAALPRRGGLLGQASILTLTANGIETSPVTRGVWVLENILGTPPSPPPPDVEPIEPDLRGTSTVREQLDKHRHVQACADCHAKIDPLGFALEFFDPIGGFRDTYPVMKNGKLKTGGIPIDGYGRLSSGEEFRDERDLKRLLLERKDQFTRTLVEKLLVYGTGRRMIFRDHDQIQTMVKATAADGYGLRNLVHRVVSSKVFNHR